MIATMIVSCDVASTTPRPLDLTGTWGGVDSNKFGRAVQVWVLKQSGNQVTGTANLRPIDPNDGTCGSCHRNKDGELAGTISGAQLTFSILFPKGGKNDPTPACSIAMQGTVPFNDTVIAANYAGADPCESTVDGVLSLSRIRE